MKIKENVTLYYCDFCKKELKLKHAMIKHEKICACNPENHKACTNGCVFMEAVTESVWFRTGYDYENGEELGENKDVTVFKCTKLDKLMFPYSIERRGLHLKYDTYDGQEPMPNKCEDFSNDRKFLFF